MGFARRGSTRSSEGRFPSSRSSPPATENGLLPAPRAKRLLRIGCRRQPPPTGCSPKANSPSVCLWRLTGKLSRFSKASALKFLTFVTQSSSTNVQHTTTKRAQRRGFLGGACGLRNSELAPPKGFLSLQTETKLHIKSTIKNHSTELLHQER